jgi:hypothetical protein
MGLKHFVNEAFLALEVVIELTHARFRCLDNVVRASRPDPLFVKEIRRRADDLRLGLGPFG